MEEWNNGRQGCTGHLQLTMVASKATISLFLKINTPPLHYSFNTPITSRQWHLALTTFIEDPTMRGGRGFS